VETDIALAPEAERDLDGVQRVLVLIGLGYAALVCLAFYADHKIQLRRARKRREARESADAKKERDE
jgi:uncharacterized membrane protein YciS (DUF1049 family)